MYNPSPLKPFLREVLTRDPTLSAVALEAEEDEEPRSVPRGAGVGPTRIGFK